MYFMIAKQTKNKTFKIVSILRGVETEIATTKFAGNAAHIAKTFDKMYEKNGIPAIIEVR